jgi:hypothetical protein
MHFMAARVFHFQVAWKWPRAMRLRRPVERDEPPYVKGISPSPRSRQEPKKPSFVTAGSQVGETQEGYGGRLEIQAQSWFFPCFSNSKGKRVKLSQKATENSVARRIKLYLGNKKGGVCKT